MAEAINIDQLVELVTLGTGTKLTAGYPHPDLWWASEELYHGHSPQMANAALDDAGYTMGGDGVRLSPDGERLSFQLICDANSPTEVRTAELISSMLAEIGVAKQLEYSAEDIGKTVHAHPTLSEAIMEAALAAGEGAIHI